MYFHCNIWGMYKKKMKTYFQIQNLKLKHVFVLYFFTPLHCKMKLCFYYKF